jgi:hypothetical protein
MLADTNRAHGRVPVAATARPLTTAWTRMGSRTHSACTVVTAPEDSVPAEPTVGLELERALERPLIALRR